MQSTFRKLIHITAEPVYVLTTDCSTYFPPTKEDLSHTGEYHSDNVTVTHDNLPTLEQNQKAISESETISCSSNDNPQLIRMKSSTSPGSTSLSRKNCYKA
jgi:hypothetical protein